MFASTKEIAAARIGRVDPHRKLMAAVLQTVVDDCRGSLYRRKAHPGAPVDVRGVRRAFAYMASSDRAWPFSFENLCDALGMDAGHVRQQLEKEADYDGIIETSDCL